MTEIRSILIIKMSALGDVIMTLPTLLALKRRYPDAVIDWLVEPLAAELLAGHPAINRLVLSPRHTVRKLIKSGRLADAGRQVSDFIRALRRVNYDVIIDLQGLLKSGIMVALAKGRRKIGWRGAREWAHLFLNEKMPAYDPERHAVLRYLDVAAHLGAETEPTAENVPPVYFNVSSEAAREAASLLGSSKTPYVALHLGGSKWEIRRWPEKNWSSLAACLSLNTGFPLVLTGGAEDFAAAESVVAMAHGTALNLCGRTSLKTLAAVFARALLVVTADTGPAHLAAAVGGRGLAVFGATRPWRTGPFSKKFEVIQPPLDCVGCLRRHCAKPCLETVTPEMIWARLAPLIEQLV